LPPDDHECGWKGYARQLEERLDHLTAQLEELKRHRYGRRSEKTAPVAREVRKERPRSRDEVTAERRAKAEARDAQVETITEKLPVPDAERHCPACGNTELGTVGDGKPTTVYEYVPGYFRRRILLREILKCSCGQLVSAPTPDKSTEKTRYAPSFIAHVMVQKCAQHVPVYRLEKHFESLGIPVARSTMNDLLHRNAALLDPIVQRLLARIAAKELVHADETPMKSLAAKKRGYVWTFLADNLVAYVFSESRSSETPKRVLGATTGTLVVDAFTGYNAVVQPGNRKRAGCLAHARRKIYAARGTTEADDALAIIRQVYIVEHDAQKAMIVGTDAHLSLREAKSRVLMARLLCWAKRTKRDYGPKSTLGNAARYVLKNRQALGAFLFDAKVPIDNNPAERQLRRVALGRKNYLFVGDDECGANIAGIYSLIATCELNKVDPQRYLEDVLVRISSHPASRIDELLPDKWRPPDAAPPP
jgi:transposase